MREGDTACIGRAPAVPLSSTAAAVPMQLSQPQPQAPVPIVSESVAKDAIIAWFRGEFAAANAIIDALCSHLGSVAGGSEYDSVFAAIHRRRLNWIPILQMQKYCSIADVTLELGKVAAAAAAEEAAATVAATAGEGEEAEAKNGEELQEVVTVSVDGDSTRTDASQISDAGSHSQHASSEHTEICSNHEDCGARAAQIKLTKGFVAKEPVKGHMVNVLKGLKLYEDIFTESELLKLIDSVNDLRAAGHNGELSGETFILFNRQVKGNKRELIQLGVPIFGQIREEETNGQQAGNIEPIPALLHSVIDHLVIWQIIPDYKRPNSCILNFFDEGEYSQPFLKPPHLEQPITTLLLSESTMAFGRTLTNVNDGNFKGPLVLSLKEGSLLVMRGNSADMARHVMCTSPIKRVSITFFRVRPETKQNQSPTTVLPLSRAMAMWQPSVPDPYTVPNGVLTGYEQIDTTPKWSVLHAPMVMLTTPEHPMMLSPRKIPNGGTGVFLPWTVRSKKSAKHLPPRAQKGRLLTLPKLIEGHVDEPMSD